ncbi:MAG: type II toxin-antitoxin system VapC family toxin [Phycisphaerae bacterium]|nr:PIN domain-containing protein [Tepidisphaeraceae bacterium]
MTPVFLDTVGLIAVWDRADQWHAQARAVLASLMQSNRPLITTTFVLLECANTAARTPFRDAVSRLRFDFEATGNIIFPTPADWANAWTAYELGHSTKPGIVDLVSFEVMRRLGITEAFTNDRHFKAFAFETLF